MVVRFIVIKRNSWTLLRITKQSLGVEIVPNRCERHQPPPEGLHEGPGVAGVPLLGPVVLADQAGLVRVLLREVDQRGVGQDGHRHQHQQQPQLLVKTRTCESGKFTIISPMYLVGLLQCVDERLEASKVSDQFEDPQNPHDAD